MFTASFWKNAAEYTVLGFVAGFVAALPATQQVTLDNLKSAAIAGGVGALYAFIKQLGGVQAASGSLKVGVRRPKAPQSQGGNQ